jgi:ribosomal protein S14
MKTNEEIVVGTFKHHVKDNGNETYSGLGKTNSWHQPILEKGWNDVELEVILRPQKSAKDDSKPNEFQAPIWHALNAPVNPARKISYEEFKKNSPTCQACGNKPAVTYQVIQLCEDCLKGHALNA